jgi:hypothetical protein
MPTGPAGPATTTAGHAARPAAGPPAAAGVQAVATGLSVAASRSAAAGARPDALDLDHVYPPGGRLLHDE